MLCYFRPNNVIGFPQHIYGFYLLPFIRIPYLHTTLLDPIYGFFSLRRLATVNTFCDASNNSNCAGKSLDRRCHVVAYSILYECPYIYACCILSLSLSCECHARHCIWLVAITFQTMLGCNTPMAYGMPHALTLMMVGCLLALNHFVNSFLHSTHAMLYILLFY